MPIGFEHLLTSHRIIGWYPARGTVRSRKVIGTGFSFVVPGEAWSHSYLITAAHVLRDQDNAVEVQTADPTGGLNDSVKISPDAWQTPLEGYDLALARWSVSANHRQFALNLSSVSERFPYLGEPMYYVGILTALGQPVPVVRSGTVAALNVTGLGFEHGFEYPAHLVDCRSYDGFSGSPCYIQDALTVLEPPLDAADVYGGEELTAAGISQVGTHVHNVKLIGMFTSHTTDRFDGYDPEDIEEDGAPKNAINRYGIGAMLGVDEILRALFAEEVQDERMEMERKVNEDENPPSLSGASRKPKAGRADRDERVSLHPLDPEDALRALLDTPRDQQD